MAYGGEEQDKACYTSTRHHPPLGGGVKNVKYIKKLAILTFRKIGKFHLERLMESHVAAYNGQIVELHIQSV